MTADALSPLTAAARRRSELTRQRAHEAIRVLDQAGTPVTFAAVAQRAGVSRSWLYHQPDVRTEIDRLRRARSSTPAVRPSAEQATTRSQQQRIATLLDTNRALRAENDTLRRQIATVLGEQRTATTPATPNRH